ncbi:hypothetical protein EXIGLDRAFT_720805 [Exidia glandulosa HHB12029]|uniref:Clathrin light chain n=1 Tax=Exidia glandulosa HHB12029 TaxID=1314781 RepID=A0A165G4T4_EXIGL|nr:hypothetical protein EXIGLDRAFT_720805 [Exidia glandulosa HHB12029]
MADLLGGDNDFDDFDRAASTFPDLDALGEDAPLPEVAAPRAGPAGAPPVVNFAFEDAPVKDVKVTGDDEIEKFESNFPDIGTPASPPPPVSQIPSFRSPGQQAYTPQPSAPFTAPQTFDEEEPEVIKEWRAKQQEQIAAREEAAKRKRDDTIAKAEQSIDDFYRDYNEKKRKQIAANKVEERDFIDSLTSALSQGTTWSRICDVIELQNSQSKTLARAGPGTTDLTRFREVLLRLKREGETAPGAGGY